MATVHVKNIASSTSEKEVRDFFSFCGKISSLEVKPASEAPDATKTATVTFEKETAAKTALLLDNTQLGPAQVSVSADPTTGGAAASSAPTGSEEPSGGEVANEDKPRTRILAEYLAHGYAISDKAIQNAIDLDQKHGVSTRFTSALQQFDTRTGASEKVAAADARLKVSEKAGYAWSGFNSYFEKAIETPTGQKLRQFYLDTNKQVMDVHNEARHLANLKKPQTAPEGSTDAAKQEEAGAETGADPASTESAASAAGGAGASEKPAAGVV